MKLLGSMSMRADMYDICRDRGMDHHKGIEKSDEEQKKKQSRGMGAISQNKLLNTFSWTDRARVPAVGCSFVESVLLLLRGRPDPQ